MGLTLIDAGHGMGNRAPGVFDPGIIGVGGTREADLTIQYAVNLAAHFARLGVGTVLARRDNEEECSLSRRVLLARQSAADFLISLHFNGDAQAGNTSSDGKNRGFQVLYRPGSSTARSLEFAQAIIGAMSKHIRACGPQPIERPDLYVVSYQPSLLLEVLFLDDPEDAALALNEKWMHAAMADVAGAITKTLGQ